MGNWCGCSRSYVAGGFIPTKHQKIDVPLGKRVTHNKRGMAFLVDASDDEARDEHKVAKIPIWSTTGRIGDTYGPGYQLFFEFIRWTNIFNGIMMLIAAANFIPHMSFDGWQNPNKRSPLGTDTMNTHLANLYISTYDYRLYPVWLVTVCFLVIFWFITPFFYAFTVTRYFHKRNLKDNQNHFGREADLIESTIGVRFYNRWSRQAVSYLTCALLLLLSFIITAVLVAFEFLAAGDERSSQWGPIVISLVIAFLNWIWYKLATLLTSFEKHKTWSSKKRHATIKYYCFRVLNVCVLYLARWVVRSMCTTWDVGSFFCANSRRISEAEKCGLETLGNQTLYLLLVLIFGRNLWHIFIYTFLVYAWKKFRKVDKKKGEQSLWPAFDVAEEYLAVLYRQFVVMIGMTVFPLAPALNLVAGVIEYYLLKFKFLRMSKPPHTLTGSMKGYLVILLFVNAVLATAVFPSGVFWMVTGFSFKNVCESGIFYNTERNCTITLFGDQGASGRC